MGNLRSWRCCQPLIHRAALVGFDMAEGEPPKPVNRNDPRNSFGNRAEQCAWPRVEEQWFFGLDQELVEREPVRRDAGHASGNTEDTVRDLMDCCHCLFSFSAGCLGPSVFYTRMCNENASRY